MERDPLYGPSWDPSTQTAITRNKLYCSKRLTRSLHYDVIASVNCVGITLTHNHFSLNSNIDGKTFTKKTWIINYATEHISYNKNSYVNLISLPWITLIRLPNSQKDEVFQSGCIKLFSNLIIHNVLYVPSFHFNLFSIHKLYR